MKNGAKLEHLNRTGIALSPALTAELLEGTSGTQPSAEGDAQAIAEVRIAYAASAEPVGSVPPPATVKGVIKSAAKAVRGKKVLVFLDKLGERLAFERSGTRLYDALLSKFDAYGTWDGGPSRGDLEEIRDEERAHFLMLRTCIRELGGDPTAVTPSGNLHAVASQGLCAVLTDPRTDLREGLEAILQAELVDNDCWENLSDLARALGHDDLSTRFEQGLAEEREHLRRVRLWLGIALSRDATGELAAPFAERTAERERRDGLADSAPGVSGLDDDDQAPRQGAQRPSPSQAGRGATKQRTTSGSRAAPGRQGQKARGKASGGPRRKPRVRRSSTVPARKRSAGRKAAR